MSYIDELTKHLIEVYQRTGAMGFDRGNTYIGGIEGTEVSYVVRNCEIHRYRRETCPCLTPDAGRRMNILHSEYNCVLKNHGLKGTVQFINCLTPVQREVLTAQKDSAWAKKK